MRALRSMASSSVLLLLAVVLGLVTAGATFAWLQGQDDGAAVAATGAGAAQREVVVVLEDVPAGTRLPEVALEVRSMAEADVLDGAHAVSGDVVGRVARYPLLAGEQVTEAKLVGEDGPAGSGLAYSVAPGMRAVSVPVSEVSGAGGLMVPGDRVDVMVVTQKKRVFGASTSAEAQDNGEDQEPTVVTVLQDVLVLAVGQSLTAPADGGRDPATLRADDVDPQPGARSVTLAVTPEQSQALFMASNEGPLGFAVRAFGDGSQGSLTPLTRVQPASANTAQVSNP